MMIHYRAIEMHSFVSGESSSEIAALLRKKKIALQALFRYNDALACSQQSIDMYRRVGAADSITIIDHDLDRG